jgi:A/G-specific adenine glycosylase
MLQCLGMADKDIQAFQRLVLDHYHKQGRHDLPWRQPEPSGSFDPYKILVSELMLQQTQVPRVVPKFLLFTEAFPSFESLAVAPLSDVLKMDWAITVVQSFCSRQLRL